MKLLIFIVFFLAYFSPTEAQYPITNYTTKDYGRDFHPSNLSIIQDQRGVIYTANGFMMLEFDGNKWNSYPINKKIWILSLAINKSGIIYAGAQNEFGYFIPDSTGKLTYSSLSDSLMETDREFTNVWKVGCYSEGVFFQSEEKVFLYQQKKLRVINPKTSFHTSFIIRDELYIRQRDIGLMKWDNNNFELIPGGELFKSIGIFAMLPYGRNNNEIIIATREKGLILMSSSKDKTLYKPFHLKDSTMLKNAVITDGIEVRDGSMAFGTMNNGLIIIDSAGKTTSVINHKSGLNVDDVKQIFIDQSRNIWLALNNGISRVDYSSPLSFYTEKLGITGNVNTILRFEESLYVGTSTGLFVLADDLTNERYFKPYGIFSKPIRKLIEAEGDLLVINDEGLFNISRIPVQKISEKQSFTIHYSEKLKLLFVGGPRGLTVFRKIKSWDQTDLFKGINSDIIGIAERKTANSGETEIWLGTRYEGVIRLKINQKLNFQVDNYYSSDGFAEGPVMPYNYLENIVFGSGSGLSEFIDEATVMKSLPDSLKNRKEFNRGFFSSLSILGNEITKPVSAMTETPDKIWMSIDNKIGFIQKNGAGVFETIPFQGIDAGRIDIIYPDKNNISWIGTSDGLIRYAEKRTKNYSDSYKSLIRRVTTMTNDSSLFSGTFFDQDSSKIKITTNQPSNFKSILPFKYNSLHFDFSAPFFEYNDKLLFSCRLAGFDTTWTPWEHKYYQEYTNLNEGSYLFQVRARNVYDTESEISEYRFIIKPPWYRTNLAFILYAFMGIVLLWFIIKINSYRLKRENIRLEGIVEERTREVVKQKEEIQDSIRYAKRIQSAVIPSENDFRNIIPESFVLFKPLDIVSGDFYWISRRGDKIIVTAADCTGHGVPGAFMSMLGVAFLNEIVNKDGITSPAQVLNHLRKMIIDALQQQGIEGEAKDGMDIAIICIDEKMKMMEYAGAYNSLIMVRNNELSEIQADKMPIAIYEKMQAFQNHEINLENGDVFYFFSDGYVSQFGGGEGKKFKSKNLKNLLLDIHSLPMDNQKLILNKTFEDWKGNLEQVDDIVIVGLKLSL